MIPLCVAGLLVEEHKILHVAGLWLDDAIPYGTRLPVGA